MAGSARRRRPPRDAATEAAKTTAALWRRRPEMTEEEEEEAFNAACELWLGRILRVGFAAYALFGVAASAFEWATRPAMAFDPGANALAGRTSSSPAGAAASGARPRTLSRATARPSSSDAEIRPHVLRADRGGGRRLHRSRRRDGGDVDRGDEARRGLHRRRRRRREAESSGSSRRSPRFRDAASEAVVRLDLDLASFDSVAAFAAAASDRLDGRVDVLVHNAATLRACANTTDGFEVALQTNYLAPRYSRGFSPTRCSRRDRRASRPRASCTVTCAAAKPPKTHARVRRPREPLGCAVAHSAVRRERGVRRLEGAPRVARVSRGEEVRRNGATSAFVALGRRRRRRRVLRGASPPPPRVLDRRPRGDDDGLPVQRPGGPRPGRHAPVQPRGVGAPGRLQVFPRDFRPARRESILPARRRARGGRRRARRDRPRARLGDRAEVLGRRGGVHAGDRVRARDAADCGWARPPGSRRPGGEDAFARAAAEERRLERERADKEAWRATYEVLRPWLPTKDEGKEGG